jgi:hypothetical protein
MSSTNDSQTDSVPHDEKAGVRVEVRVNTRINTRIVVRIHVDDGPQDPSDGPNSDQSQQSDENNDEETSQAVIGPDDQQDRPEAETSTSVMLSELAQHPLDWPADGFADDDPAAAHMAEILQSLDTLAVRPCAVEDIIITRTTDEKDRKDRPFEQLSRRGVAGGGDGNFFLPNPSDPGNMTGKVDCSKTGLTVIMQALREVVRNHGEAMSISPSSHQADQLDAANGAMSFTQPNKLENSQTYGAVVDPFTPKGARTAAAALQLAARDSTGDHVIFCALAVLEADRDVLGKSSAILAVYPMN